MNRDRDLAELRAAEGRAFLERNAATLRRIHWRRKAEQDLAAHRRAEGY